MKKFTLVGAGIVLLLGIALVPIAFNLEPSLGMKRIGWAMAFQWNRVVALTGNADAQHHLGYAYATGEGVNKDYAEAVKWFRLSAGQGDATSLFNIGVSYDNGWGVKQSYKHAIKWYELAASKGNPRAHFNLGYAYEHGTGVTQDYRKAKEQYGNACELGEQEGCDAYRRLNESSY